jgi:hypothetical protein
MVENGIAEILMGEGASIEPADGATFAPIIIGVQSLKAYARRSVRKFFLPYYTNKEDMIEAIGALGLPAVLTEYLRHVSRRTYKDPLLNGCESDE